MNSSNPSDILGVSKLSTFFCGFVLLLGVLSIANEVVAQDDAQSTVFVNADDSLK